MSMNEYVPFTVEGAVTHFRNVVAGIRDFSNGEPGSVMHMLNVPMVIEDMDGLIATVSNSSKQTQFMGAVMLPKLEFRDIDRLATSKFISSIRPIFNELFIPTLTTEQAELQPIGYYKSYSTDVRHKNRLVQCRVKQIPVRAVVDKPHGELRQSREFKRRRGGLNWLAPEEALQHIARQERAHFEKLGKNFIPSLEASALISLCHPEISLELGEY